MSIDFNSINATLLARSREFLTHLFPAGKIRGHEFILGNIHGDAGESMSINLTTGIGSDFATGETFSDLIAVYAAHHGIGMGDAAKKLSNGAGERYREPIKAEPLITRPPLQETPACHHHTFGYPSKVYRYEDAQGLMYVVARYDVPSGKQIMPWAWSGDAWIAKSYPKPRPLYNLKELQANPKAAVLIVEGEKCVDHLIKLGIQRIPLTWPGGANAWKHADWSALAGCDVLLFPDHDAPGFACMDSIGQLLTALCPRVRVINHADCELADGWDIADTKWTGAQLNDWAKDLLELVVEVPRETPPPIAEAPKPEPAKEPAEAPTDHRCRIKWAELKGKTPPDREWTISHWLTNGPTLLAGQGGIGKTHIAQTLGTAIAMGKQYIDVIDQAKRVLFWACEDDHDELWRRQIAICRHFDIEIDELEDKLIIEPRLGMENGLLLPNYGAPKWTEVKEVLREQVNDYQAEVLIVDNIGQCFGGNENDRHHVTAFLSGLVGLSVKPLAVLMLGHPAKSTGSEYSGSTAWEAAVRMRWYLGRKLPDQEDDEDDPVDDNTRYLCKRKANYSQLDYRQLAFQDGVYACQQPEGPTFTERFGTGFRKAGAESLVMLAIENAFASKIRVVAQENSPDSLLKHMRRIGYCQDYNNREILDAIARLRMERRIGEVAVGHYSNRMPKMGLAPARIGSAQSDSQSTT